MGTRDVGRCARARAGGSARARRKLNQGFQPNVPAITLRIRIDTQGEEHARARHHLGLNRLYPYPNPARTTREERTMRDTTWG
jgi:hypothetical protein